MANTIFFFFSFVLFLPFVSTIHFNIPRFGSHITEVVYQGDARANGAVELTNIDYTCRTGWATYSKKIPLWDPEIGQPSDFTTSFSFRIDTHGVAFGNYGHGFAFFLAPLGIEMLPTRPVASWAFSTKPTSFPLLTRSSTWSSTRTLIRTGILST